MLDGEAVTRALVLYLGLLEVVILTAGITDRGHPRTDLTLPNRLIKVRCSSVLLNDHIRVLSLLLSFLISNVNVKIFNLLRFFRNNNFFPRIPACIDRGEPLGREHLHGHIFAIIVLAFEKLFVVEAVSDSL